MVFPKGTTRYDEGSERERRDFPKGSRETVGEPRWCALISRIVTCGPCGRTIPKPEGAYTVHECLYGSVRIITLADWQDAYPEGFWRDLFTEDPDHMSERS